MWTVTVIIVICIIYIILNFHYVQEETVDIVDTIEYREVGETVSEEYENSGDIQDIITYLPRASWPNGVFYPTSEDNSGYAFGSSSPVSGKKDGTVVNLQSMATVTLQSAHDNWDLLPQKYTAYDGSSKVETNYVNKIHMIPLQNTLAVFFRFDGDGGKTLISDDGWKKGVDGIDEFDGIRIGKGRATYKTISLP